MDPTQAPVPGDTSSAPPPSGTPPPSAPSSPPPSSAAAPSAPPSAPAKPKFEYDEDRSTWVPSHRVRELSAAQQRLERELQFERQRVAALSGVQPPSAPIPPGDQALRDELYAKFPELKELADMREELKALRRLKDFDPAVVSQSQDHYFESLGSHTLAQLDTKIEGLLGGKLTPFAQQSLHNSFGVWVASDPQIANRYTRQDPTLLDDFVKEYQTGILDPFRRKITTASAPQQDRTRRFPQQGNTTGAQVPSSGRPATLKPSDSDEYHLAAFRSMTNGG